jgi:hypothetical protein
VNYLQKFTALALIILELAFLIGPGLSLHVTGHVVRSDLGMSYDWAWMTVTRQAVLSELSSNCSLIPSSGTGRLVGPLNDWPWMMGRRPLTKISSLSPLSSNYSLIPSSRCISPPYPPCCLVGPLNDIRLGLDDGPTTVNKDKQPVVFIFQLFSDAVKPVYLSTLPAVSSGRIFK